MDSESEDGQNHMEEAGGRECEKSRVEDRRTCRSNEMEGRSESDRGGDEVYPATFGDEEKTEFKLDDDVDARKLLKERRASLKEFLRLKVKLLLVSCVLKYFNHTGELSTTTIELRKGISRN